MVNTPPPKGGGFGLRLKPEWAAELLPMAEGGTVAVGKDLAALTNNLPGSPKPASCLTLQLTEVRPPPKRAPVVY